MGTRLSLGAMKHNIRALEEVFGNIRGREDALSHAEVALSKISGLARAAAFSLLAGILSGIGAAACSPLPGQTWNPSDASDTGTDTQPMLFDGDGGNGNKDMNGDGGKNNKPINMACNQPQLPPMSGPPFVENGASRGFTFFIQYPYMATSGLAGPGACAADYDNDDDLDPYFPTLPDGILLNNDGSGNFSQVIFSSPSRRPVGPDNPVACGFADLDDDGDEDLLVLGVGASNNVKLYENLGPDEGFEFQDVTAGSGIEAPGRHWAPTFGDVDGDGDLDPLIAGYVTAGIPSPTTRPFLFINNGDLTFLEEAVKRGLFEEDEPPQNNAFTFVATFIDIDGDGDPDLYLAKDGGGSNPFGTLGIPNKMCVNIDGTGNFEDQAGDLSLDYAFYDDPDELEWDLDPDSADAMGLVFIDHTNNGQTLSPVISNISCRPPLLFECDLYEDGAMSCNDRALPRGLTDMTHISWGVAGEDFDLDGDHDLLFLSGYVPNNLPCADALPQVTPPMLLFNSGGDFAQYEPTAGDAMGNAANYYGIIPGDFDGDGDVDVIAVPQGGSPAFFENQIAPQGNPLVLDIFDGNRRAIGALVRVTPLLDEDGDGENDACPIIKAVTAGEGFAGFTSGPLYFGLGEASEATVEVQCPGEDTMEIAGVFPSNTGPQEVLCD